MPSGIVYHSSLFADNSTASYADAVCGAGIVVLRRLRLFGYVKANSNYSKNFVRSAEFFFLNVSCRLRQDTFHSPKANFTAQQFHSAQAEFHSRSEYNCAAKRRTSL